MFDSSRLTIILYKLSQGYANEDKKNKELSVWIVSFWKLLILHEWSMRFSPTMAQSN